MKNFNGIINYTIIFTIIIILLTLLLTYKKAQRCHLHQSIPNLLSIILCIYFFLTIDRIYTVFEYVNNFELETSLSYLIMFLIFLFLYLVIKVLVKLVIRIFHLKPYLYKTTKVHKTLNYIFIFGRKAIFLIYLIVLVSLFYDPLYYSGITQPVVRAGIINNSLTPTLDVIADYETSLEAITDFTDLFNLNKAKTAINWTERLFSENEKYQEEFINKIYSGLSSDKQELFNNKYLEVYNEEFNQNNSKGILTVLLKDNLYQDVFSNFEIKFYHKLLTNIPYVNKGVNIKETIVYRLNKYLESNKNLILWLEANTFKFADLALIYRFKTDYQEFKDIGDKNNKRLITSIYQEIDRCFYLHNWTLEIAEIALDLELAEQIALIEEYLQTAENLDTVIIRFNKDFENNVFKAYNFEAPYQFTELYLKEYQDYSLKVKNKLDPKIRIAAAMTSKSNFKAIIYQERSLYYLLLYLNNDCHKTKDYCDVNKTFHIVDSLLWGLATDKTYRISSAKIADFYQYLDKLSGYDKKIITAEIIKLNDKLIISKETSYIETNYNNGTLGYDVLKLLYREDNYTSKKFNNLIQDLIS